MPINELRSITTFVRAAELGSLRKAAAAQGMTPQAASQALAQLERHLGVRLFHRTTRSLSLTDEGQQFLDSAQPAVVGLQRALQVAKRAKEEIAGPLRIVGPRSAFPPVLWPVLEEFCRLHPDVQPDVQFDDRIGNWVEDRVDVGFRIGSSPQEGVIARRLFPLQLIICAAPGYLQRHGAPDDLNALGSHRCSAFRHPSTGQGCALAHQGWRRGGRSACRAGDVHKRRRTGAAGSALRAGHRPAGGRDGGSSHSLGPAGAPAHRARRRPCKLLHLLRQSCCAAGAGEGVHRPRREAAGRQHGLRIERQGAGDCGAKGAKRPAGRRRSASVGRNATRHAPSRRRAVS